MGASPIVVRARRTRNRRQIAHHTRSLERRPSIVETKITGGGVVLGKRALGWVVFVALVVAAAPSVTYANGARGGSSGFRGGHFVGASRSGFVHKGFSVPQKSVFPVPVDPWKSWGVSPKHHHGFHHRAFTPFVSGFVGASPLIVSTPAAPVVVEASPIVYVSPVVSTPAPAMALPAPVTLPTSTLVEHPDGWYQLRGDGATTPYRWVWVPKPPVAPISPTEPAPSAKGADAPARGADTPPRPAESRARDSRGPAYHWTDDRGVTTWTNRLERVPKRFRDQAAATAKSE
jgi:hypothetical protein